MNTIYTIPILISFLTDMAYRSFLTYQRSKGYLLLLEENGLIEFDKEKRLYKSTEKGMYALQAYNGMRELIDYS